MCCKGWVGGLANCVAGCSAGACLQWNRWYLSAPHTARGMLCSGCSSLALNEPLISPRVQ